MFIYDSKISNLLLSLLVRIEVLVLFNENFMTYNIKRIIRFYEARRLVSLLKVSRT